MDEIEVVIKIPEEVYDALNKNSWNSCFVNNELAILEQAFCNGKPLPKGHGRLCDIDAALKCMEEVADDKSIIKECAMGFLDWACSKRVILEADKGEEE